MLTIKISLIDALKFLKSKGVKIVFITDNQKNSVVFNGDIKKAITFVKKYYNSKDTRGHVSAALNYRGAFIDIN